MENITEILDNFNTKHKQGFTQEDIIRLLEQFPSITLEKFNEKMGIVTVLEVDGEIVYFRGDVELILRLILENRDIHPYEWD